MSRTIRRKNAWDKEKYVPKVITPSDYEFYTNGVKYFYTPKHGGKYKGCTPEQIHAKLDARYHGETPINWSHKKSMKQFSRWYLRNKNNQELRIAVHRGEEEGVLFTMRRQVNGNWWWYD